MKYGGQNVPGDELVCLGQAQTLSDVGALLRWVTSPPPPSICMFPEAVRMQLTDILPQGALLTEVLLLCPDSITAISCKGPPPGP